MDPSSRLVGRAAELRALAAVLDGTAAGRAAAVALVGEPGIGKTRLLAELGARADARGMLVLSGSASEFEGDLPFWVFVDALDEYLAGLPPGRLDADETRAALAGVFPALPAAAVDARPPREDERYRTHRAVRRCLEQLAARDAARAAARRPALGRRRLRRAGGCAPAPATGRGRAAGGGAAAAPGARPARRRARATPATRARGADSGGGAGARRRTAGAASETPVRRGRRESLLPAAARPRAGAHRRRRDRHGAGSRRGGAVAELALLDAAIRRALDGAAVAGDPFVPELAAAAADLARTRPHRSARRAAPTRPRAPDPGTATVPLPASAGPGAVTSRTPGGGGSGRTSASPRRSPRAGRRRRSGHHHVAQAARTGDADAVAVLRRPGKRSPRAPPRGRTLVRAALDLLPDAARPPSGRRLVIALARAERAAGDFVAARAALLRCLEMVEANDAALRIRLVAACASVENVLGHPTPRTDGSSRRWTACPWGRRPRRRSC